MTKHLAIAGLAVAALATTLIAPMAAGATGPGLVRYSVRTDRVVTESFDADNSPCGTAGTVTFDEHTNAAVAATEPGLTDDEVVALLQDDPDGVIRQLTQTSTGTAELVTAGHVYTGRFTIWFGGHWMPNGMYVQTGTFSLTARSELGTLLRVASGGHDLDGFDGTTKMFTQHGSVSGCLP